MFFSIHHYQLCTYLGRAPPWTNHATNKVEQMIYCVCLEGDITPLLILSLPLCSWVWFLLNLCGDIRNHNFPGLTNLFLANQSLWREHMFINSHQKHTHHNNRSRFLQIFMTICHALWLTEMTSTSKENWNPTSWEFYLGVVILIGTLLKVSNKLKCVTF